MIGVISSPIDRPVVEEFFQLFKTPWEFYNPLRSYETVLVSAPEAIIPLAVRIVFVFSSQATSFDADLGVSIKPLSTSAQANSSSFPLYCGAAAIDLSTGEKTLAPYSNPFVCRIQSAGQTMIRVGYDLFAEARHLITHGQPPENAARPTLDAHIDLIRSWLIQENVNFLEIPPAPKGYDFAVSLTHDIDFIGLRQHKLDHTALGFLFRSTVGATLNFLRGRSRFSKLAKCWLAAFSTPFVHLGLLRDFWVPFEWYLNVEKGLNPTYFFIPFKRKPGSKVNAANAARRGTAYDITEIPDWIQKLREHDCEVGVHGIDAWHDIEAGKQELARVKALTSSEDIGIRMHWLLRDNDTYRVLEAAGYNYDSTCGYNETIGFRAGTTQVFKPLGVEHLLEIPMHIQDGALFYKEKLNLTENQAWERCSKIVAETQRHGGVLTLLWHDRSHGPERFWGEFYSRLVEHLKTLPVWFASAGKVVGWFRHRREIRFERNTQGSIEITSGSGLISPPVKIHVHNGSSAKPVPEIAWDGSQPVFVSLNQGEPSFQSAAA